MALNDISYTVNNNNIKKYFVNFLKTVYYAKEKSAWQEKNTFLCKVYNIFQLGLHSIKHKSD
jgi:hypothetical protein